MARETRDRRQYGDFQTPPELAESATLALRGLGIRPQTILEPTCGRGAFLLAALRVFPDARQYIGVDINEEYLAELRENIAGSDRRADIRLARGDFFRLDWLGLLGDAPRPILILGNPPWVTNSELGALASGNLPKKSNTDGLRGYDALTGKSNFDISEWMLSRYLDWLGDSPGTVAVLCKTAVARKVLRRAWRRGLPMGTASLFTIDAREYFGVSVDACFLVIETRHGGAAADCAVYEGLAAEYPSRTLGYRDGMVLSDVAGYERWRHLRGGNSGYIWRSGIKHDCAGVMELAPEGKGYRNGLNEFVDLESAYVYPLLKSSDLSRGSPRYGRKYLLVTQGYLGEDTSRIGLDAPRTWDYLRAHRGLLEKRASSIYRDRPEYSIFGIGEYSFASWKVAISGFNKRLDFQVVAPYRGKPVMVDDTVCFLPCGTEAEARSIAGLLNSEPARQFLESMIFWVDKRPITIELLKRLDLRALCVELYRERMVYGYGVEGMKWPG